jgi:hypothetical protein
MQDLLVNTCLARQQLRGAEHWLNTPTNHASALTRTDSKQSNIEQQLCACCSFMSMSPCMNKNPVPPLPSPPLQELTGVMRRALSQQAPVREALYEGILQILAADPASAELLAELLLPHMRSYMLEDDQQLPRLLLHKCAQLAQVSDNTSRLRCDRRPCAQH